MFRKSSHSGPWTDNCVEVDTDWTKSSACDANGGQCVETHTCPGDGEVWLRDSKDPSGPVLRFNRDEWLAFTAGVKADEFDLA